MEELKALLPEIQEKVEDATEGLKTASTAAEAAKSVLVSQRLGFCAGVFIYIASTAHATLSSKCNLACLLMMALL